MDQDSKLNDAPILDQMDGHWQKMMTLVLLKLLGKDKPVKITLQDILAANDGDTVLFTHGMVDGVELSVVTAQKARELAAYADGMKGSA